MRTGKNKKKKKRHGRVFFAYEINHGGHITGRKAYIVLNVWGDRRFFKTKKGVEKLSSAINYLIKELKVISEIPKTDKNGKEITRLVRPVQSLAFLFLLIFCTMVICHTWDDILLCKAYDRVRITKRKPRWRILWVNKFRFTTCHVIRCIWTLPTRRNKSIRFFLTLFFNP